MRAALACHNVSETRSSEGRISWSNVFHLLCPLTLFPLPSNLWIRFFFLSACAPSLLCLTALNFHYKKKNDMQYAWIPQNPHAVNYSVSSRWAAAGCYGHQVLILQIFHTLHRLLSDTFRRALLFWRNTAVCTSYLVKRQRVKKQKRRRVTTYMTEKPRG